MKSQWKSPFKVSDVKHIIGLFLNFPLHFSSLSPFLTLNATICLLTLFFLSFFLCTGEWENSCNELQRMLIVRSLRQDRVSLCVTAFVINNLDSHFVEPPILDMKAVRETRTHTHLGFPCLWGLLTIYFIP